MKNIKWVFVIYSIAAVLAMCGIGIAVAMRSIPVALIAMLALIFVMGNGFKTKKKMREKGLL
ncbi:MULTISPECIES: YlaF family protein [Sporosarcina]|uniref:YlaF family protein n=1 Tax=Sporosarcina saromensis TaxID=359365 RepID=A0ABU4G4L9_9BACL|nr:YlaF family protein [Sporosarcina saromensis]MDW0111913.1 YlaF family protein [Sporosarcina saromensis]